MKPSRVFARLALALGLVASMGMQAQTQYALPYGWTGGNGTSGQCLTSNGSVLLPSFQACGTGGLAPIASGTVLGNSSGSMAPPSALGVDTSITYFTQLLSTNGAALNGTTDDAAAIQAAINAAQTANTGGSGASPQRIVFPANCKIKINSGLTIDIGLVSINFNNCVINAAGMTTGTALSLTSTTGSVFAQSAGGIERFYMFGPGASSTVIGVSLGSATAGKASAHTTIRDFAIKAFFEGIEHDSNSYTELIEHGDIYNCMYGVRFLNNQTGAGELPSYIKDTISNNSIGMSIEGTAGTDVDLASSSLDYNVNQINVGNNAIVRIHGSHLESDPTLATLTSTATSGTTTTATDTTRVWTTNQWAGYTFNDTTQGSFALVISNTSNTLTFYNTLTTAVAATDAYQLSAVPLTVGLDKSGAVLRMIGGELIFPTAGTRNMPYVVVNTTQSYSAGAYFDNVTLYKVATTTNFFSAGSGITGISGYDAIQNQSVPVRLNATAHLTADVGFESTLFPADVIQVWKDTATITSQLTGTNISLTQSTAFAKSPTHSLAATKTGASGTAAGFFIAVPYTNPKQHGTYRAVFLKTAAGTAVINPLYAYILAPTAGVYVPKNTTISEPSMNFSDTSGTWITQASPGTNIYNGFGLAFQPNYYGIFVDMTNMAAGTLYIDDVDFYEM